MNRTDDVLSRRRKRTWRYLVYVLVGLAITLTLGACVFVCQMRRVLVNAGFFESWREGVDGQTVTDLEYGAQEWNRMDVYIPREISPQRSSSAVVYIHGGAWVMGSRREENGEARRTAKLGYLTATIDYMLCTRKTQENYSMEQVLEEIDAALIRLREFAHERGLDLQRVALSGTSAGGHIASLYAYSRGERAPIPVVFVSARVAPIDFHEATWREAQPRESLLKILSAMRHERLSANDWDESNEAFDQKIDSVSPLAYLTPEHTVPTLSCYGDSDMLIGPGHVKALQERFEALGAKSIVDANPAEEATPVFDCILYVDSGHLLESDKAARKRTQELFTRYAQRYLDVATE